MNLFDVNNGHKDFKENEIKFFGEWVYWEDDEEKEDAITYLSLWKKFLLKKLPHMVQDGHDQIVLRPVNENQATATLGIKIAMKRKENE